MRVWIQYDDSPEHLPICMADTARELAKKTGYSLTAIKSAARRLSKGSASTRFAFVDIPEEEKK